MAWIYLYPVLILALVGVAIYEHVIAARLHLPLPSASTVLAILLPIIAALNTASIPLLSRSARSCTSPLARQLLPAALLFIQFVLTNALATLFFSAAVPSDARACLLGTAWQKLFRTKNTAAIRYIQDTFDCCGFNSVRDRAWPLVEDLGGGLPCAERFGRTASCAVPWTAALQRTAGVDGGVAVATGVLQVVIILALRWLAGRRRGSTMRWPSVFKPLNPVGDEEGTTRPLLAGADTHVEDGNDGERRSRREVGEEPPARNGYGGTGTRVEPSSIGDHEERNAWEEED